MDARKPAFTFTLPSTAVQVMDGDIDDIMYTAMSGCTHWCDSAEPVDGYLGEYASEQISRGGKVTFYPDDDDPVELDKEKFEKGLHKWLLSLGGNVGRYLEDGWIDPAQIDDYDADAILQYALFDDIVYG